MSKTIENIDISRLPEQVRQELYDFYQFLMQKYSNSKNNFDETAFTKIFPRKVEKFKPYRREDVYAR